MTEGIEMKAVVPHDDLRPAPEFDAMDGDMDCHVRDYCDDVTEHDNLCILGKGESLINGIRRLDSDLVTKFKGKTGILTKYTILEGQIGCCTFYGSTHFLPPGNYFRIGLGCVLHEIKHEADPISPGTLFRWKDVSYVSLPENTVAVVQEGDRQVIYGSGRYILRNPLTLHGVIDVQDLKRKESVQAITEEAAPAVQGDVYQGDVQKVVELQAGQWEKIGAVTFVRAQPGFAWVVQNSKGQLRSGIGFCVCRGGEIFKQFVDLQHYARTTRAFILQSKDRQSVRVRVQLRWRLEKPRLWMLRQGASEDIFDAIEEIAQAMLRDAIASQSYEDCAAQAQEGYEGIEKVVRAGLAHETEELGGRLLGFEIRELRFPLLDQRNAQRAEQEAKQSEQLLSEKRRLEIEHQERLRDDARRIYDMKKAADEASHLTNLEKLREEEMIAKQMSTANVEKAQTEASVLLETTKLEANRRAQALKLETEQERHEAEAKIRLINVDAEAAEETKKAQMESDKLLVQAQAAARATLAKAEAEATAKLRLAEADAKAAELLGAAFAANPMYVEYRMAQLRAEVLKERARTIGVALQNNKGAMMPVELQRELAILDAGFTSVAPLVVGGGSAIVGANAGANA